MSARPKYATATAFRRALEDRLKALASSEGVDLQRLRRELAFDRLLARLFAEKSPPWVLKGGYAMELRIKEARASKDIDLALRKVPPKGSGKGLDPYVPAALQKAADKDLGDYFSFLIGESMTDLDAVPYGGARYPIEAQMDGRTFVTFHVDVAAGDPVLEPLETTEGRDWLAFAGIPGARYPTICAEQQFAEKLHAYTVPRKTPNSRVRDIVDLLLLIKSGKMKAPRVGESMKAVFDRRKTHAIPKRLDPPPKAWERPYQELASECSLSEDLNAAFRAVEAYFAALQA